MASHTGKHYDKFEKGKQHLDKGFCLRYESAATLLHAERFARELNKPFTHAVTINLAGDYRHGMNAKKLFQLIRNNLQAAWRRRRSRGTIDGPLFYSAVFENPQYGRSFGQPVYGPIHVHCMIRWNEIPIFVAEQIIERALRRYLKNCFRQRIYFQWLYNSTGYAMYQAKGIDPPYAKHYHIIHTPQGPVPFKRIRVCNALNENAMQEYEKITGHHRFHNADKKRKFNGHRFNWRTRKLKPLTKWKLKMPRSAPSMRRMSPQHP